MRHPAGVWLDIEGHLGPGQNSLFCILTIIKPHRKMIASLRYLFRKDDLRTGAVCNTPTVIA